MTALLGNPFTLHKRLKTTAVVAAIFLVTALVAKAALGYTLSWLLVLAMAYSLLNAFYKCQVIRWTVSGHGTVFGHVRKRTADRSDA